MPTEQEGNADARRPSESVTELQSDATREPSINLPTTVKIKSEPKEIKVKSESVAVKIEPQDNHAMHSVGLTDTESQDTGPEPMPALDRTLSQLSVVIFEPPKTTKPDLLDTIEECTEVADMPEPAPEDQLSTSPVLQEESPGPSYREGSYGIAFELPPVEHLHAKSSQTSQEERDQYRKKLSKGLKMKHDGYLRG